LKVLKIFRKSKSIPLQARSGPEGSRKLRFPDYVTTTQDGGKTVSLTHQPLFTPRKYCRLGGPQILFERGEENKELISLLVNKINHMKTALNPICHLLALLGAHHILHVSGIRV